MYEHITSEIILKRMLDTVPNTIDKREGSIIYDALMPAALELKKLYVEFDDFLEESFADTASREFLIRRAKERGIDPDEATHAILQGEFTPSAIEVTGKRFSMPNTDLRYTVGAQINPGVYQVFCERAGAIGNNYLGAILPVDYILGLQTAELTGILIPGSDEESTESLREKYFRSFDINAFGGNKKDYLDMTNSLPGVGSTKVTPIWDGGGTVKLTILDAMYNPASTTLIDAVQDEIDPTMDGQGIGRAPIGHIVTVDTAAAVSVAIETAVTCEVGYTWAGLEAAVIDAIEDYLLDLRAAWASQDFIIVFLSVVNARIMAVPGVVDVQGTTINGAGANLVLSTYEIPIFGGIVNVA